MNLADAIRDDQHQDAQEINTALNAILAANGDEQQIAMVLSDLHTTAFSRGYNEG